MNDGSIRRWKEGKRHNAHLKVRCPFLSIMIFDLFTHSEKSMMDDFVMILPIKSMGYVEMFDK